MALLPPAASPIPARGWWRHPAPPKAAPRRDPYKGGARATPEVRAGGVWFPPPVAQVAARRPESRPSPGPRDKGLAMSTPVLPSPPPGRTARGRPAAVGCPGEPLVPHKAATDLTFSSVCARACGFFFFK